jgi:hypothetical protein
VGRRVPLADETPDQEIHCVIAGVDSHCSRKTRSSGFRRLKAAGISEDDLGRTGLKIELLQFAFVSGPVDAPVAVGGDLAGELGLQRLRDRASRNGAVGRDSDDPVVVVIEQVHVAVDVDGDGVEAEMGAAIRESAVEAEIGGTEHAADDTIGGVKFDELISRVVVNVAVGTDRESPSVDVGVLDRRAGFWTQASSAVSSADTGLRR